MKLWLILLAIMVMGILCGLAGWLVGALIGGNYAVGFTFNGVRGYEAMGQLGFIGGVVGGGVLAWYVLFRAFWRRRSQGREGGEE